jgi:hypothetical protein
VEILKLLLAGLHIEHAVQRESWIPTEYFVLGLRKTTENWPVAGSSYYILLDFSLAFRYITVTMLYRTAKPDRCEADQGLHSQIVMCRREENT